MKYGKFLIWSICILMCGFVHACSDDDVTGEDTPPEEPGGEEEVITVNPNKVFIHPGALHTTASLNRVKTRIQSGDADFLKAYNLLKSSNFVNLNYAAGPTKKLIRGGSSREEPESDNYGNAMRDAAAAYQMALMWHLEGDEAYAEKSIEILNKWASTCEVISGDSNIALGSGIYGYEFANAAELMRDYSGWADADFDAFKDWLKTVFIEEVTIPFLETHWNTCDSHYWSNWDLCNLACVLSVAIVCDDVELYTYGINYLMTGIGNGRLINCIHTVHQKNENDDVELGQMQEAGRDQGHTLMCIGLLGTIAEIAWNQGEDIYGYKDNLILKGAEYVAKYNYTNLNVPFSEYYTCTSGGETHTEISNKGKGERRPIWERIYGHYNGRKGLSCRYMEMAVGLHRPEAGSGVYDPNSGGYDDFGLGTLLYSHIK